MNASHAADPAILTIVITAIEFSGVAVIVIAALVATVIYIRDGLGDRARWATGFQSFRATLGRGILLGLEFLIAADIIRTITLDPTIDSLIVLGGIVVVRTFLSLSLQVEIDGRWPWQSAPADR